MLDQEQLEALLGRPLTQTEIDNLDLYLDIAQETLEDMLCMSFEHESDETRVFDYRQDYRTIFTGAVSNISEVKVGEDVVTNYDPYLWDTKNSDWFNSIVFTYPQCDAITVTADWGFETLPNDLARLLAQMFGTISKKYSTDGPISSKRVEDFAITFATDNGGTDMDRFVDQNKRTLDKYSICGITDIKHGKVCTDLSWISSHYWIGI